jgi:hypothetical protein
MKTPVFVGRYLLDLDAKVFYPFFSLNSMINHTPCITIDTRQRTRLKFARFANPLCAHRTACTVQGL